MNAYKKNARLAGKPILALTQHQPKRGIMLNTHLTKDCMSNLPTLKTKG